MASSHSMTLRHRHGCQSEPLPRRRSAVDKPLVADWAKRRARATIREVIATPSHVVRQPASSRGIELQIQNLRNLSMLVMQRPADLQEPPPPEVPVAPQPMPPAVRFCRKPGATVSLPVAGRRKSPEPMCTSTDTSTASTDAGSSFRTLKE